MKTRHRPQRLLILSTLCFAALCASCSETPDKLMGSARQYMSKNDYKAAIIQVKNALQTNPNLPEARYVLGKALLETGDAAGAEAELRRALSLNHPREVVVPPLARAMLAQREVKKMIKEFASEKLASPSAQGDLQLSLATAYGADGQPALAEAAMATALDVAPEYPPAMLERARRMAMQGDDDGALKQLDAVIAQVPDNQEAWRLKGDLLGQTKGRQEEAIAAYRKSLAIKPDSTSTQTALIMQLIQATQLEQAGTELVKLQKMAPNHPNTFYAGALLAFHKKDLKSASELVQQSLGSAPNDAHVLQLAGAIELQQQHLPQAQSYLSRALESVPSLGLARRLLVVTFLRQQLPTRALETLLPGLKKNPEEPDLVALAGEVYFRNGDLAKAEEYFTKASKKDPSDGRVRTSLALVEMAHGQGKTGISELQGIAASDSGVTADMALISALVQRQEYEQALKAISVLEAKQPKQPVAAYLRARVQISMHNYAGARESLQQSLALEPGYFPSIASLAILDVADKKPQEAIKRFEAMLKKDPKNLPASLALANLTEITGGSVDEVAKLLGNAVTANPSDPGSRLQLIELYMRHKDAKSANAAAQAAVAALPDEPRLVDALGRSQQASGDPNQAIATFRKLAELMPQSPLPYWRIADAQLAQRDKAAGIQSLQKALSIKPDFLEGQRALIGLYVADKRQGDALAEVRMIQKQRPKEDVGYLLEADIHGNSKSWDKASAALQAGLTQVGSTSLATRLHTVYRSAGKSPQAEQFSAQWLKDHPNDAAYLFYLGDQALAGSDYTAAEQQYGAVVRLQPGNAMALNNLAWVSGRLKKDGAIAYAEKANALAPNQPAFMDTLANLQSESGNHAQALEIESRALALQPQNTMLKLNLARISVRAGKRDAARKALDELSQLGDAFPGQSEVAKLRKELGTL